MLFTIFDKTKEGTSILGRELKYGTYKFHFNVPLVNCSALATEDPQVLNIHGYTLVLNKIEIDAADNGHVIAHISFLEKGYIRGSEYVQSGAPSIAVICGALSIVGIIATVFLTKVEKVVTGIFPTTLLLAGGLAIFGGAKLFKK